MLVKDLLILFQAGNEGVINVLGMPTDSLLVLVLIHFHRALFRDVARRCPGSTENLPTFL